MIKKKNTIEINGIEQENIRQPQRENKIDVFRSFGIILMVMVHTGGFPGHLDYFVHAFHMPMFWIISGYFFKLRSGISFFEIVKKKAKSLLIPYVAFGIFHYLIYSLTNEFSIEPFKYLLWDNTVDNGIPIAGALWFLTAFFFSEILYFCIRRYIDNDKIQISLIVLVSLCGCYATRVLPNRMPFAIDAGFVGVGLIHIGYLSKKYYKLNFPS